MFGPSGCFGYGTNEKILDFGLEWVNGMSLIELWNPGAKAWILERAG